MNRREFLGSATALWAGASLAPVAKFFRLDGLSVNEFGQKVAQGYVFHDVAGRGKRDSQSIGLAGVFVSNGREVAKTDRAGKWSLPVDEDSVLFVIKPSGWKVPVNDQQLPQGYYIHKPKGSPKFDYVGIQATGDLPDSIDFPLMPQKEDRKFRMMLFGDPQPRNQMEINYMAHDVIEQAARDAAAADCKFGLSLGDIMFDDLSLYDSLNRTISSIGLPWYNVVGNHDLNFDAEDDREATDTFKRVYGPNYYAFNYGPVHFIVLDNVIWEGKAKKGYHGEISAQQLEFVKNDLATVAKDRLVVVAMHIPFFDLKNKEDLFRLLEDRPHTFSWSAHTHLQGHHFLKAEDGWKGENPHHHLNHATVCGCWWGGAPDERGIPHATMGDGCPNGYSIVEFDGRTYKVGFRSASRPEQEQMSIWLPESVERKDLGKTEVIVNVFAGSERSVVEVKFGDGDWSHLANFRGQDPYCLAIAEKEASATPPPGRKTAGPAQTKHLWIGTLPSDLRPGVHTVLVKTTDMFGQIYSDRRIFHVV